MFNRLSVLAIALTAAPCYSRDDTREGLMQSISNRLEASSGNLRRNLKTYHHGGHTKDAFDACHLVSQHFGEDFLRGGPTGGCKCEGSLDDVLNLDCDFENVCDDTGTYCASVDVNVTLTDVLDNNGIFGKDPKMSLASCVDTDMDFLEKMCLHMDFAKPDFFLPSSCSFSYGDDECICKIDKSVPCYDFDCSQVAPDTAIARMLVSDSCKTVDLSGKNRVSMFIPALSGLDEHSSAHNSQQLSPMEEKFALQAGQEGGN